MGDCLLSPLAVWAHTVTKSSLHCLSPFKIDFMLYSASGGNNFNDFPANRLSKFRTVYTGQIKFCMDEVYVS